MPKFKVWGKETVYYEEIEIEADNIDDARNYYEEKIGDGGILATDSSDFSCEIELINNIK